MRCHQISEAGEIILRSIMEVKFIKLARVSNLLNIKGREAGLMKVLKTDGLKDGNAINKNIDKDAGGQD